jgi:hypothetical protein
MATVDDADSVAVSPITSSAAVATISVVAALLLDRLRAACRLAAALTSVIEVILLLIDRVLISVCPP